MVFCDAKGIMIHRTMHKENGEPKSQDDCRGNRKLNKQILSRQKQKTALFTAFRGSLTLEAAVALPIVILFLTVFLSFFSVMAAQLKLQNALARVGRTAAAGYYAVDEIQEGNEETFAGTLGKELLYYAISETAVRALVYEELDQTWADSTVVKNGFDGISFLGSRYDDNTGLITLQANYELNLPFAERLRTGIDISQRAVYRAWTGKPADVKPQETMVYVAENGKVYHTSLACTHIRLSISEISTITLESARNLEGGKYQPCELCGDGDGGSVYITEHGDRYHYDKNCSGLKRTITSVPLSETGLPLCTRCRERSGE